MEGWKAYVNGRQRPIAPGIWRVLELPEGEHQIDFVYDPPGLRAGFLVFLPSLLLAGLGGLFGRERK